MRQLLTLSSALILLCPSAGQAQNYSPALLGSLGLNTVPSARMDRAGTITLGVSSLDPYLHGYLGFQITDGLNVTLRQTGRTSRIFEDPKRLYPGVDVKLRLVEESRSRPEISVGLQSAAGHKRTAGEYIALSKRYKDFDFTAGIGWGRYGSAGHIDNPLDLVSDHFGKNRNFDGEMPNDINNWFTGHKVGLFGGVEYFTPLDGLSLKFDWGADRFEAEQAAFGYNTPAPWSAGISYWPVRWANLGVAAQGTEKIMGRISLKGNVKNWRDQKDSRPKSVVIQPFRSKSAVPRQMEVAAAGDKIIFYDTRLEPRKASTYLKIAPRYSAPDQIGRAAVHMANNAGSSVEELAITPVVLGLRGPQVSLMRRDFERALVRKQGSPEEIWRNVEFIPSRKLSFKKLQRPAEIASGLLNFSFTLDNRISLAEEDSGVLYRSSVLAEAKGLALFGLLEGGSGLRINLKDNLEKITKFRSPSPEPIRSDVNEYTARTLALDTLYTSLTHSLRSDTHVALTGGYLEEMYGGYGGEILFRPHDSRLAFGAEAWHAFKRDSNSGFNLDFTGENSFTGHMNIWYDLPEDGLTFYGKAGQYLGEDKGGTLGLLKKFSNGAELEAFLAATDESELDLFGGANHIHHGMRLTLPLSGFPDAPDNTYFNLRAEPFGRDIAQAIKKPVSLYELTEPFTLDHMARHWNDILPRPAQKKIPPGGGI